MQSLVLFNLTALKAALVGPFRPPIVIVVDTLPGLRFAEAVPCDGQKASVSSHHHELKVSGGNTDIWREFALRATRQHPRVRPLSSHWRQAKFGKSS